MAAKLTICAMHRTCSDLGKNDGQNFSAGFYCIGRTVGNNCHNAVVLNPHTSNSFDNALAEYHIVACLKGYNVNQI